MDTPRWPQVNIGGVTPVENLRPTDKKPRPEKEQALNCPRCNSSNTKFCYYNNYSLSQPRYFCKGCRRYWTDGGTLRNVPVGGGSRKNKRPSSSILSGSKKVISHLSMPKISSPNPKIHTGEDLSLGFNQSIIYNGGSEFVAPPFGLDFRNYLNQENPNFIPNSSDPQIMDAESMSSSGGMMISSLVSSIPHHVAKSSSVYSSPSSFPMHGFNRPPGSSFSQEGLHNHNGYGNLQAFQDPTITSSARTLIISPIEEMKASSGSAREQFHLQDTRQTHHQIMDIGMGCWLEGPGEGT